MELPVKPKRKKSNVRLILFLSILAVPLLVGIVYPMVDFQIHHGIKHHEGYEEVDLKSLGYFTFDANGTINQIPARWRALDGKRVQLEGFPWSLQQSRDLTRFEFVYNVGKCCFNGPPLVQERVYATMPRGRSVTTDYSRLVGILHVKVEKEQGVVKSVYTMDVEKADSLE